MKNVFILFLFFVSSSAIGQITAPDTVCAGTLVNFSTTQDATTYAWDFNTMSVVQPISPVTPFYTGGGLSTPAFGTFLNDGGNYYYFTIDYSSEQVVRFSFGTSIHNTPTVTNLGTFGMSSGSLDGLDIVKDSATGNWYGVITDYSSMGILSFGSSLSTTPTCTITTYPCPAICWAHHTLIKRYRGNWHIFMANRSSNMIRFDFGSSLTSTPAVTVLPNVGGLGGPDDFTIYQQGGNWYMIICNLIAATLVRYDFGPNLLNNAPTGTSLGNPGGLLNLPRPIAVMPDCQGHLLGYVGNENGTIIKLDFAGSITNIPTATTVATTGIGHFASWYPVNYNDTLSLICVDATLNRLWTFSPYYYSTPTTINYYNNTATHTFATPGVYHISLFKDAGNASGPSVACKDIVVVSSMNAIARHDTTVCTGTPVTLIAGGIGTYLWNTGATSPSIVTTAAGVYWAHTIINSCASRTDTTVVHYSTTLPVSLGNDTSFCAGPSITLHAIAPMGSTYFWSTGNTGPSVTVNSTGTYWVRVNDEGCAGADTINVTVKPNPTVHLGPDITVCSGSPVTLLSTNTYTGTVSYLWSNGATGASIMPSTSGVFWLTVTVAGCSGSDTVNVTLKPIPVIDLGADTVLCRGVSITLANKIDTAGDQYLWSTGSTAAAITASDSGTYSATVTLNGCSASDAVVIITKDNTKSVSLGPDTTLCRGESIVLVVNDDEAIWSNNFHGTNLFINYPGTYWVHVPDVCGMVADTINVDFHLCDIGFPSAFTPNGDGHNDVIGVVGTLKYFNNFSLSIYNRWGERVYYSEDIYAGWDGIYNGEKQDLGTYFYMIFYNFEGKRHMMKGDFELIR